MIKFHIISIFPETFDSFLQHTIIQKAIAQNLCEVNYINLKEYNRYLDDKPYGGGAGMILKAEVIASAIDSISYYDEIIYFSPRGKLLTQEMLETYNINKSYVIICGRYEGIDQRVIDEYNITEISLGSFVLSCGELPAMCFIDGLVRFIPNVVGNQESVLCDSFSTKYDRKAEYPLYTMPAIWRNRSVPEVLTSGNHAKIAKWKKDNLK